jgi:tRNA(Ile)-lysidine synthase
LPGWVCQIETDIAARGLFRDGQKILAAVSGGVDSMVLLHGLHQLAGRHGWKLTVAHFNHQLRGRAGDADELLVRQTARRLQLPFVAGRGDVRAASRREGISVEMAGRKLRHEFLARAARRLGIPAVALAHHADDQVELFFLRLLRGAGAQGLAGMKWSNVSPSDPSVVLARPLLHLSKAALREAARAGGIRFYEDATNAAIGMERNRIRHELIPLLREHYQPRLEEAVLRLMELAGSEAEVVTGAAAKWLQARRRAKFGRLPVAVQRRLLQLQLFELKHAADFDLVERLRATPNRPFALDAEQTVMREADGTLRLQKVEACEFDGGRRRLLLKKKGRASFDGLTLWWEIESVRGKEFVREPNVEYFDAAKVGPIIWLRHWQPGDRFQPIGTRSGRKLQDLFTNLKVARAQRHRRIVAATIGDEPFWVEGLRLAEGFKLEEATTRRLRWRWRRAA